MASPLIGPEGTVHAFEPDPISAAHLIENVDGNRFTNIRIHRLALSDREGLGHLTVAFNRGSNSLFSSGRKSVEVRLGRLDDILTEGGVSLVKLDIEGGEQLALRGMTAVVSRSPNVKLVVEWNRDYASESFLNVLLAQYNVWRIDEEKTRDDCLVPVQSVTDLPSLTNLWCVPK